MAGFSQIINRTSSGTDTLVPEPFTAQVIQEMPKSSAILSLARRVPMTSKTARQPVLSALPDAYFVTGDTGLKQTTAADWDNLTLTAEEIAVIVLVPDAYFDDAGIPIWENVRPLVAEAFGRRLDRTILFNEARPATWGAAIVNHAIAAGNQVVEGTGEDLAEEVAELNQMIAEDGGNANGYAVAPGFPWRLVRLRSVDGIPIYAPPAAGQPGTLYGAPLPQVQNGGWFPSVASLIAGDWSKAILGVRQEMQARIFTEGVISNDSGQVVHNLMQQDTTAMRFVARFAWQIANPINPVNTNSSTRSYFGVLTPASS